MIIHTITRRILLLAAAVLPVLAPHAAAQECYTPLEWIPKNYVSNLDRNKNFVDDAIEKMSPKDKVHIILCLNSCASDEDLRRFQKLGVGEPSFRGIYLSTLNYRDVTVADAIALGRDERVAMVHKVGIVVPALDISLAAAKVTHSSQYPNNVEDMFPGIDGTGVNIAIMDSGVDNEPAGTTSSTIGHKSLPGWKFIGGYDTFTQTEGDPTDEKGHGTYVASIAMGATTATQRGVAPGAGLIDIKIFNTTAITSHEEIIRAMQKVIERKHDWNIGVVNMSFADQGIQADSDGSDPQAQWANRMVRAGMVVVGVVPNLAGGMELNTISSPGSADFVITTNNVNDRGNVDRSNDKYNDDVWPPACFGPRWGDGDQISTDEQKPDVSAHGTNINAARFRTKDQYISQTGTSAAAPHVSGLAALILDANPGMDPLSVKELIQRTAEDKGDPGWDGKFGHGLIDAYAAVNEVVSSLQTDVFFEEFCNQPGNPEWWTSSSIEPDNSEIVEGEENDIRITVHNSSTATAYNVKVRVGIYDFSNSTADFDIAMHNISQIDPGDFYEFTVTWTPEADGMEPPVVHACLKAYIIYPNDTDPSNNCAQHNVNIKQTHSPAPFPMTVVNPTGKNLSMEIYTDPTAAQIAAQGWKLSISEQNFRMRSDECPKTVVLSLEAAGAAFGDEMPVNVYVRGREGQGEYMELGGVRIIGVNGDGTPRPPDGVVFDGIRHLSLGQARLFSTPGRLTVSEVGGSGDDGVKAWLGTADFWRGTLGGFDTGTLADGSFISFTPKGSVGSTPATIATLTIADAGDHAQFSVGFRHTTTTTLTVEVFDDGMLIGTDVIVLTTATAVTTFANAWYSGAMKMTPYRQSEGDVYSEISFDENTDIEILGTTAATLVSGDRIVLRAGTQATVADHVEEVEILAAGPTTFTLTGEAAGLFERPFKAMGNPLLEWKDDGQTLTAGRRTERSAIGAWAEVPELKGYDLAWTATDINDMGTGGQLSLAARGNFTDAGLSEIGAVWLKRVPGGADIRADLERLGVQHYQVEVYNNGSLVYSAGGFGPRIGLVNQWPDGGGHAVDDVTNDPSFRLFWPVTSHFALANSASVWGDEIRIMADEDRSDDLKSVTEVGVYTIGLNEFTIISEEATSLLPVSVQERTAAVMPFRLHQNYPNPFAERTMFRFDLLEAARVELEIYSLTGERIATVLTRELGVGTHETEWKRQDASVSAGAYIYRLKVVSVQTGQTFELQRKMMILD